MSRTSSKPPSEALLSLSACTSLRAQARQMVTVVAVDCGLLKTRSARSPRRVTCARRVREACKLHGHPENTYVRGHMGLGVPRETLLASFARGSERMQTR